MSNTDGPGDIDPQDAADETEVRIRRAPKYSAFLIVGGGLGAVITFILTAIFPVDPQVGFGALFGYFALYGVTAGVLLGAIVAIILDRRSIKRARTAEAVVETTEAPVWIEPDAAQPETPQPETAQPEATPRADEQNPPADGPART